MTKVITKVNVKAPTLIDLVEVYGLMRPVLKDAKKKVEGCQKAFKDSGKTVIKGKNFTVSRKETEVEVFDSEAFKAIYGEACFDKFKKSITRTEFVVVPNR